MQVRKQQLELDMGARFGSTYTKIGMIQRRLAWPLCKDDTQIREAFHIFFLEWGGFPGGSDSKVSACSAGDPGSIPGSRRSPGEGNGNPLQHSCLENPMDRGA